MDQIRIVTLLISRHSQMPSLTDLQILHSLLKGTQRGTQRVNNSRPTIFLCYIAFVLFHAVPASRLKPGRTVITKG